MSSDFSPVTDKYLYCHHNGLLNDDLGRSIVQLFNAGLCDEVIVGIMDKRISQHKFKQALCGNVIFKTPQLTKGDYIIGYDNDGNKLLSFIQYLNAHCLTIAGSGAGKTTYSYFKILQIAPNLKSCWLFDMCKSEFPALVPYLARVGVDLNVIPVRSLRINPLQLPSGVELSDWIPRISDTLVESLELPPRASKLLQVKLFELYHEFDGSKNLFPMLFDLFEKIKNDKSSNHQARSAVLDSFEPVLRSLGAEVLAYRCGWSSSDLANHHIAFEFSGCSEMDKNLLLNSIVLSEFTSRVARGISNRGMDLMIFIDEAQRLCSESSAIANMIGLIRGTGIGLDLSLQSAKGLAPQIISNTASKVLGRCGSYSDYSLAGASIGLNSEMIHWAQINLDKGVFICQLGEGQWRYPFVFTVPNVQIPDGDTSVYYKDNPFPNLTTEYASEFTGWPLTAQVSTCDLTDDRSHLFGSDQEYKFCKAVVDNPMKASSEYAKLAGISPNKATVVRKELLGKLYIREHKLASGAKGRSTILLDTLPEGIKAVNEYGGKS